MCPFPCVCLFLPWLWRSSGTHHRWRCACPWCGCRVPSWCWTLSHTLYTRSTSSVLSLLQPSPSFAHFAPSFLPYVVASQAPARQAGVHHVSVYHVPSILQLWEKCHEKYYIQNDAYSLCACVAHLQSQSILHTTYMHGTCCRGNPDHAESILELNKNANHTHHTCTYFPDAPECEITVRQVDQKFLYTSNICTDPSCPLGCGCRPMTPCHASCHVWPNHQ